MLKYLIVISLSILNFGFTKPDPKKPNVVFILVDDMGYADLGCYGQKILKTPNIDQLAKDGMKFTQHYAGAPVCAPSRCSLMTGKHVGNCSVRGNQPKGQLLKPEETTLAEVFQNAGYTTGLVGKWGMGNAPETNDPNKNGFDYNYGYVNMWHAHNFYPEFLYRNAVKVLLPNVTGEVPEGDYPEGVGYASVRKVYAPDEFDRDAIEFIDKNKEKPFFLYLAINTPHGNSEYKEDGKGMEVPDTKAFDNTGWNKAEKSFAEMIRRLDNTVAMVRAKLKAEGLDENTMIIFASDNGPHSESGHDPDFFDSNGKFRGQKRDLYEGGIRIPYIVTYPGKVKPNQVSNVPFAFWDFLPTACELIGQPIPKNIDGISFLPTLMGKPQKQKHDYLYWEFYEGGGKQAVLWNNWKGIRLNTNDPAKTSFELYNLGNDPGEMKNIAAANPKVKAKIEAIMKEAHSPFPLTSLFSNDPTAQRDVQKKN